MALVDLPDAPRPSGNSNTDTQNLLVYSAQLREQLEFILTRLDDRNFTKTFLDQIGGGTNGNTGAD